MDNSTLGSIALFGAAGAIGHSLASELQSLGIPYRAVGRDPERLRGDFPGAAIATADFFTKEGVGDAAAGIDTIFYLAGAPYTEFFKHPIMVRNALDAARAPGVKRFVHVTPVYSYGPPLARPVPESQPHVPSTRKGRFRLEQEQAVLQRNAPGFATMVVHLPDFYGPHAELSYANAFVREALSGKTASFIGPLDVQREFLFVPDAAAPLLALAALDDAYGRCWNLGGESIGARDFANAVFAALGKPPKYRSVPKWVLQIAGIGMPLMREVAEMYYLFDSGFTLDDAALRARLGEWRKTPLADGIAQTTAWMR
ncbi:MAG TPA: NAD-dependent epimerase/dehydratase family protein [Candidatus Cybelea sp.]|jgi:nucleoside-diphosphate-sugar epimerase